MYYSKCNFGYVVRAEIGEEIQESLKQFAEKVHLKGAFYQGIGTLSQVELAFFRSDTNTYERKFFCEQYELISLTGNLSASDGSFMPHSHVTLCDRNFQTFSGHLVRGVVCVTAEIFVWIIDLALTRKDDPILKYKGLISPQRTHLKVDV
ncbi:MAG TPA: PPC domain-containing DNA-binding protein [Chlamydiales bacterium]|nr:PPC domain-containing DNA-binding protein [Chlamydiales bacterium]